ncbi:MAG TPA: molybdopterin molybdotransferase MoeA, partial [Kiloniellaceae bacterium]|nr:molybdopterin molybdotransferase MoeA [Kiloniellaceae bacterium]
MVQLTDDCFAHGGRLMRTDEALALLTTRLSRITEDETCPLADALGRVLTEDILSAHDVPPRANAAVDGYALRFEDLRADAATQLPVEGRSAAGHPLTTAVARGTAVRIFTGAVVPEGLDTVVMQEDCKVDAGAGTVEVPPGLRRGANYRSAGEDMTRGDLALTAGQRLRPQDLGLAAAAGRKDLLVAKPLRVALFSTGDELREPGEALPAGAIYDSNRYTLMGLLTGLGCRVGDLGILPDKAGKVTAALEAAAAAHDVIITSGGVSVGEEDHV